VRLDNLFRVGKPKSCTFCFFTEKRVKHIRQIINTNTLPIITNFDSNKTFFAPVVFHGYIYLPRFFECLYGIQQKIYDSLLHFFRINKDIFYTFLIGFFYNDTFIQYFCIEYFKT